MCCRLYSVGPVWIDAGSTRRLFLLASLLILAPLPAFAQQTDDIHYYAKPGFFIPFHAEQGGERVRQIRLFVSEDQGNTWNPGPTAFLQDKGFKYQTSRDGTYWFNLQTIDTDGRTNPPSIARGAPPLLKVVVDTQPPVVSVVVRQFQDGSATAEWRIRDENLKLIRDRDGQPVLSLDSFRLEFRVPPNGPWMPLQVPRAAAVGNFTWNARTTSPIEVRLQVWDRAGNKGENSVAGTANAGSPSPAATESGGGSDVKYVNTPQVKLAYRLDEVGRSGIDRIEVYRTRDSRTWELDSKHAVDSGTDFKPVTINLEKEGLYGFSLLAISRVGLGQPPPKAGDPPQVWIEYDSQKPIVELKQPQVSKDGDDTKLTITYSASDKNLKPEPIKLFFSERQDGEWTPITLSAVENTGQYVWIMPRSLHYELFIRVEATDKAGNTGSAVSQKVTVDLAKPKVIKVDIQP